MAAMVAVLDTNPEAKPAKDRPRAGPASRSAIWPQALIVIMSTASCHSVRGFTAPSGSIVRSGTSGRMTRAAAASSRPSCTSCSDSARTTKRCSALRAASAMATTTPTPVASGASFMASAPSAKVRMSAISVVRPGSSSRERR